MTKVVSDDQVSGVSDAKESSDHDGSAGMVKYETYSKTVGQVKTLKSKLDEYESKLAEINAERAAQEEQKLRDEKKWQELAEREAKKAKEASERLASVQNQMVSSLKRQALERELGGVKNQSYLQFADMNAIRLTETGELDEESMKAVADKFRQEHPDLLKRAEAQMPTGAPKPAFDSKSTNPSNTDWASAIADHFKGK